MCQGPWKASTKYGFGQDHNDSKIESVNVGSLADQAGLHAYIGGHLVSVNGMHVHGRVDYLAALKKLKEGSDVIFILAVTISFSCAKSRFVFGLSNAYFFSEQ